MTPHLVKAADVLPGDWLQVGGGCFHRVVSIDKPPMADTTGNRRVRLLYDPTIGGISSWEWYASGGGHHLVFREAES